MGTFTFSLKDGSIHTVKTVLESEVGFLADLPNSSEQEIEALRQYQHEQEELSFQNRPPQLFKFYYLAYVDETGRKIEDLVGATGQKDAIAKFRQNLGIGKQEQIRVTSSYEKFCNEAALTFEEVMAQCHEFGL